MERCEGHKPLNKQIFFWVVTQCSLQTVTDISDKCRKFVFRIEYPEAGCSKLLRILGKVLLFSRASRCRRMIPFFVLKFEAVRLNRALNCSAKYEYWSKSDIISSLTSISSNA